MQTTESAVSMHMSLAKYDCLFAKCIWKYAWLKKCFWYWIWCVRCDIACDVQVVRQCWGNPQAQFKGK